MCDLYLLNVAILASYMQCQHPCRCDTRRVQASSRTPARSGEEEVPQRIHLDLNPSGKVIVSWHGDKITNHTLRGYKCDGDSAQRDLSRQESDKNEDSQEPKPFLATEDIQQEIENARDLQEHTTPPPQPPAEVNDSGHQLPQQRVARARAEAALRDRHRAREFAGKRT
ncbi:hypothetical protein E2C01_069973 [Portunus trituberculatus]|uniref:Uncharacterized protein n=1 Tax=Portunus trituberculatus TaxID=210409 RepID=A0A5B7I012_PORTR|nr:hypothetical protein [Portunus trituberculatus]